LEHLPDDDRIADAEPAQRAKRGHERRDSLAVEVGWHVQLRLDEVQLLLALLQSAGDRPPGLDLIKSAADGPTSG